MKKDKNKTTQIIAIAVVSILVGILIGYAGAIVIITDTNTDTDIDTDMPIVDNGSNFKFQHIDGTIGELKDFRGKYILLDLWATWCQPCVYQMAELADANAAYEDLEILSISVEPEDTSLLIKDYKNDLSLIGIETNWIFGQNETLSSLLINDAIPTLLFLDPEGNLIFSHSGIMFYDKPDGWESVEDQTIFDILLKDVLDTIII